MSTAAAIDHDLTCGGCDYNLRGLPRDGACPDCGDAVAATLCGLSRSRAAWLLRMSWGAGLIGGSILMGGAGVAATVQWREPWVFYTLPVGAVLGGVGTWLFASREPRGGRTFQTTMRVTGVATCALQLLATLMFAHASGFLVLWIMASLGASSTRRLFLAAEAAAVIWAVAAVMTCVRAARVAGDVRDHPGHVQALTLAVLSGLTLLGGAMIWRTGFGFNELLRKAHITASVVAGAWSVLFFLGFAIVLHRRARAAAPRAVT